MGPRLDNRGYGRHRRARMRLQATASMGPRSDNRGYETPEGVRLRFQGKLQWVHGRITVIICPLRPLLAPIYTLQCVHGRKTGVMLDPLSPLFDAFAASMGPRSDNRGYGPGSDPRQQLYRSFNGSTVG